MKHGSNNRRPRARGNNKRHNNNHHRNSQVDSNGPVGRVRGTAQQIMEKYQQQARDALSNGDRVVAENLFQHADHYYRLARLNDPRFDAKETAAYAPQPVESDEDGDILEDGENAGSLDDAAPAPAPAAEAPAEESTSEAGSDEEEKPRRRQTRTRRAPRKENNAPLEGNALGEGGQAMPDFMTREVPIQAGSPDTAEAARAEEAPAEDEKPKRRTRRAAPGAKPAATRTRRRKVEGDGEAQAEMPLDSVDEAAPL